MILFEHKILSPAAINLGFTEVFHLSVKPWFIGGDTSKTSAFEFEFEKIGYRNNTF